MEVFYYGVWGTVSDEDWDIKDAQVVCHQLGFPGAYAALPDAAFGTGSGKVWLSQVECSGTEGDLKSCSHVGWGNTVGLSHRNDAGVVCQKGNNTLPGQ